MTKSKKPDRTPVPHSLRVKTPSGMATLQLAQSGRTFQVVHFEVDDHPDLTLAFATSGPGVEDLDEKSDAAQCFNVSTAVRVNGVYLSNQEMRASSIEELKAALSAVKLRPYNHEEI